MLSTLSKTETEISSWETSDLCGCKNGANLRSVTIPPDHLAMQFGSKWILIKYVLIRM